MSWPRAVSWQNKRLSTSRSQKDDEHGIQPLGGAGTHRRYLGDHQYFSKLRFQREEIALDNRGRAAAAARLDPVVFPRPAEPEGVGLMICAWRQAARNNAIIAERTAHAPPGDRKDYEDEGIVDERCGGAFLRLSATQVLIRARGCDVSQNLSKKRTAPSRRLRF